MDAVRSRMTLPVKESAESASASGTRSAIGVGVAAALVATLAGCTTTYVTPIAVTRPLRLDTSVDQSFQAGEIVFALPNDWQYGTWVMKEGARIVFHADGWGSFSCTLYSQFADSADELHFYAVAYGRDGNQLFIVPGRDTGMALALRRSWTDYPYDAKFSFDPRLFDRIHDVKFYARLRLKEGSLGAGADRQTTVAGVPMDDSGLTARESSWSPPVP